MPNWVSNGIVIEGSDTDVQEFLEKAKKVHEAPSGYRIDEDDSFRFWNFIPVPKEVWDEYYPNGEGSLSMDDQKRNPNNWYDWNINNWGTKWEACRPSTDFELNHTHKTGTAHIEFDTAWAPPEFVFQAMVAQHPNLKFKIRSVEEQGWGMEWRGWDGLLGLVKEWDIPDSHAEHMEHMGYCPCQDGREIEYLWDDCPIVKSHHEVTAFEAISNSVDAQARKAEFTDTYGKGALTPKK